MKLDDLQNKVGTEGFAEAARKLRKEQIEREEMEKLRLLKDPKMEPLKLYSEDDVATFSKKKRFRKLLGNQAILYGLDVLGLQQ